MFGKVLVTNRGEIAVRVIASLRAHGIGSVAVYSDADAAARHVREADVAIRIGSAPAAESYLHIWRILRAAGQPGAQAVHPGYGFLAENAAFARARACAELVFIGHPAAALEGCSPANRPTRSPTHGTSRTAGGSVSTHGPGCAWPARGASRPRCGSGGGSRSQPGCPEPVPARTQRRAGANPHRH
jgi:hypothetical protein